MVLLQGRATARSFPLGALSWSHDSAVGLRCLGWSVAGLVECMVAAVEVMCGGGHCLGHLGADG